MTDSIQLLIYRSETGEQDMTVFLKDENDMGDPEQYGQPVRSRQVIISRQISNSIQRVN